MFDWFVSHQFWAAVGLYWVFSAAVSSMPAPGNNSGAGYLWMFRFLHTLAGNVNTVFGSRISATISGALTGLLIFLAVACAPLHYNVHPGAVDAADSGAYDTLLIAQGVIDQARTDLAGGALPSSARGPLNALIQSYNVARTSWLTYRGAVATNTPADVYLNQLNTNLTDLINAIRDFQGKEGP